MTDEPSKPQPSVPAASNKTALAIASVALVIALVGVVLAATGALVPRAPLYAPQTVNLQVAIIPDLQGGGYDVWLPNELVVHAGDTVRLTVLNSDDGAEHGLHIPEFGVDQVIPTATLNATGEVIPSVTVVTFVADHAGSFEFSCNVVCGPGHDRMTGTLEVLPD